MGGTGSLGIGVDVDVQDVLCSEFERQRMRRKGVIPPASYVRLVDLEAIVPLLYSGNKVLEEIYIL